MIPYLTAIIIPLLLAMSKLLAIKPAFFMFLFGLFAATLVNIFFKPRFSPKEERMVALLSLREEDYVSINKFYLKKISTSENDFGGYAQIGKAKGKLYVKVLSDDVYSEYKVRYYPLDSVRFIEDKENVYDAFCSGSKYIYNSNHLSIFPTKVYHYIHELHVPVVPADYEEHIFA